MDQKAQIEELLNRSVEAIYPSEEALAEALDSGNELKIYLGIDPTGPTLHLGHSIQLEKLRQFQELGHKVILLIGDFTAQIGDPSGKDKTRKPLTREEVMANQKVYKKQASKFLRFSGANKAEFKYNSKWLGKLKFEEILKLASNLTVQRLLERDMFEKRMKSGKPIALSEFMYPLMQGYDSVAMEVDGEVGGSDQTFNMLSGRTLENKLLKKNKFVIANKLLEDPTGMKMGKTEGNMVTMQDPPGEMFGKIMSWPDGMIVPAFELLTRVPMPDIHSIKKELDEGANPRDKKADLAREIVKIYHGEGTADKAEEQFEKVFKNKEAPEEIEELEVSPKIDLPRVIAKAGLTSSVGEARRLIEQGAVKLNDEPVKDWKSELDVSSGDILKVGKRKFRKLVTE